MIILKLWAADAARDALNAKAINYSCLDPITMGHSDGARQELSNFTVAVASEVFREHHDQADIRNAEVPRRSRQVYLSQVVQRSCVPS